jgi:hypothetical protein
MYCTLARGRSHFDAIHAGQKSGVVFLHGVTARCAVRRAPEMGNRRFGRGCESGIGIWNVRRAGDQAFVRRRSNGDCSCAHSSRFVAVLLHGLRPI